MPTRTLILSRWRYQAHVSSVIVELWRRAFTCRMDSHHHRHHITNVLRMSRHYVMPKYATFTGHWRYVTACYDEREGHTVQATRWLLLS